MEVDFVGFFLVFLRYAEENEADLSVGVSGTEVDFFSTGGAVLDVDNCCAVVFCLSVVVVVSVE